LECGAGKGWRRLFGPNNVRNEAVLHRVKDERNILNTKN